MQNHNGRIIQICCRIGCQVKTSIQNNHFCYSYTNTIPDLHTRIFHEFFIVGVQCMSTMHLFCIHWKLLHAYTTYHRQSWRSCRSMVELAIEQVHGECSFKPVHALTTNHRRSSRSSRPPPAAAGDQPPAPTTAAAGPCSGGSGSRGPAPADGVLLRRRRGPCSGGGAGGRGVELDRDRPGWLAGVAGTASSLQGLNCKIDLVKEKSTLRHLLLDGGSTIFSHLIFG